MSPAPTTSIIIPVHNRRDITLRCLDNLRATGVTGWARVFVVDDGSTDGTAEAVRREHPGVEILPGDGDLWWTGGIVKGMRAAMETGAEFLVWLNDDCQPEAGTLEGLVAASQERRAITVAQSRTPGGYVLGGSRLGRRTLEQVLCGQDEDRPCETFTGNCVLLPRWAVEKTGYPDERRLPHVLADVDYGLRAHGLGIPIWIIGAHVCHNEDNLGNHMLSWLLSGVPLGTLWREVLSMRSVLHPSSAWTFHRRHYGLLRGGWLFAWPYVRLTLISLVRLVLPPRLIARLYARRSVAWKTQRAYYEDGGKDATPPRTDSPPLP